jgi:Flp pilus assembly protein TadB
MLITVLLALGVAAGLHPALLALTAVSAVDPGLALAGIAGWAVVARIRNRHRQPGPDTEAVFFRALSAELRTGASLRAAIAAAADRVPAIDLHDAARRASAGMPMTEIGDEVEQQFPVNGRLAAIALRLSDWSGARTADTFDAIAARAADAAELARERRAATAQAKISALIVGIAPVAVSTLILASGRADGLVGRGAIGWAIFAVGLGLEVAGLALVALMVRRASA